MNNIGKNRSPVVKKIAPPSQSRNVFADIFNFLFTKPKEPTFISFKNVKEREDFTHRILQRVGLDASKYAILNVHKIGVNSPANHVFEELFGWNGDSSCWPNHIAKVDRINDSLKHIQILTFGMKFIPLFNLNARKIQIVPDIVDPDNARYLLYNCTGGYPIGFFAMYVRSSIVDQNEKEQTQLFFVVGFDFFGKKNYSKDQLHVKLWALIHNRVTSNVMNRFKQLCEWRFEKKKQG